MKKIILIGAILTCFKSFSQNVAINSTGNAANASAMLDVSSTTKGMLVPRMSTTDRENIASPANGLLVFDITTNSFWYFSTTWKEINNGGGGAGFALPYSGSSSDAGKSFSVINNSATAGATGVYGRSSATGSNVFTLYPIGVWGDNSTGIGVMGSSSTMGVYGTSGNASNGIGVLGANNSDMNGAVTGRNGLSGGGVRGIFTGPANTLGYGVIGETGQNGNIGVAGKFISNNPNDPTNTLWALNYGAGAGLVVTMNNNLNDAAAIDVNHNGTGKFMRFLGQNNSELSVNNNGNVMTTGTVTVKGNKGILRNSSATQMRMETPTVSIGGSNIIPSMGSATIQVTFASPFSSAPTVYIGNIITDGAATFMTTSVKNVTTTGCTFVIRNTTNGSIVLSTSSWKLIAIGAE